MKKRVYFSWGTGVALFLAAVILLPLQADAVRPSISAYLTRTPPVINGAVGPGEWIGPPQITFDGSTPNPQSYQYVIPTYVYFMVDGQNLYILVDAVGDTQQNNADECLLVFGVGPETFTAEVFGDGTTNPCMPSGIQAAVGFGPSPNSSTPHRIYEWKIPFASIHAIPGQPIDFSSPYTAKFAPCPSSGAGSMPYDADTYRDNVWPPDLGIPADNRNVWGILDVPLATGAPILNEWGLIALSLLLAASAFWFIARRKRGARIP
jgi:hypothetical protein